MTDINSNTFSDRRLTSSIYIRRLFVRLLWLAVFDLTTNAHTTFAMAANNSLTTVEMLQNDGYAVEVHNVITKDGYVLEIHRIPKSKNGHQPTRNHPVMIQHGILGSSADWVLGGPKKSLPMQLADDGYDVWITNSRGNIYCRKHVVLTDKERAFWNFSLQELGAYDLPAVIDYILSKTNTSQLHYVGFSMGTSIFFIMASERPEYQPKIRSQISLAPVAYLSNTRSILRYFAPMAKALNIILQTTSHGMLMTPSSLTTYFTQMVCGDALTQKLICEKCIIFSVCGSDPYFFDKTLIPLIFGHFPSGTSSKLAAHFAQFMMKENFCQYDYGRVVNLRHYNSTKPPKYNLKSIKVPITLMYGKNDILADTKDVMKLKAQLRNVVDVMEVKNPYCNHADLVWSVNVTAEVNDPVRESLRKTDHADWQYSGPSASAARVTDIEEDAAVAPPMPPGGLDLASYLDVAMRNLDAIIASTMPRTVDSRDRAAFDRQREQQAALFGGVIRYFKSAEATYGRRVWGDLTSDVNDWTHEISEIVARGVEDARTAVRTHAARAEHSAGEGLARAQNAAADGIARGQNAAVGSLARAKNVAVGGIERAKNVAVGGIERAQNAAVGGMARAEKSVAAGLGEADKFVHGSLHKTNVAVGNALNMTVRGLSKAFWFFK